MATIQERLNRMRQDGENAGSATLQQRLERMKQDGLAAAAPAQGGAGVTLPTASQGTVTLPRADQSGGGGESVSSVPSAPAVQAPPLVPDYITPRAPTLRAQKTVQAPPFVPSYVTPRAPTLRARNIEVVQEDMDGVDRAIQELKGRQNELNGQIQWMTTGAGRLDYPGGQAREQLTQRMALLRGQTEELDKQIAQLESNRAGLQDEWNQADQRQFDQLRQTAEFRAAVNKAMSAPFSSRKPSHRDVGYAMLYFQAMAKGDERLANAARQNADMALDRMDEGQQERLAYYVGMGDYDGAADYLNRIAPALNRAEAEAVEQGLAAWAQEHPIQGTLTNVMSWPLNIPAYVANTKQAAKNLITGKGEQDPHLTAYAGAKIGTGTSQGVQEAARSAATQTFGSETAGDVAAFLAGTGLSVGQNATQIALLGPYSLAGMSISAAGSATADALDRGATPQQAFIVGTSSGAIEAVTEKIPLDNLFRLAKEGGGKGLKAAVIELLKQMGTEASEEMISEIANNIVDMAVIGDSSEFQLYVQELQAAGLSKDEAERQAFQQFYVWNVLLAGAGGAISGGVMSGGTMTFHQAGQYVQQLNAGKQSAAQTNDAIDRAYQAMVEKGMFSQEAGQAVQEAQERLGMSTVGPESGILMPTAEQGAVTLPGGKDTSLESQQPAAPSLQAEGSPHQIAQQPHRVAARDLILHDRSMRSLQNHQASEGDALRGQLTPQPSVQTPQTAGQSVETSGREIVSESGTTAQNAGEQSSTALLEGARDTLRLLRESFNRGEISEEQFGGALELIMVQEGLEGLDMLDTQRFEGGAENGTGDFGTAAPDGQQLPGGGAERSVDQGASGQDGVLAEGGSRRAADTSRAAVERQAAGRALRLEAVSSRELGIVGGTDAQTVRLLPEDAWDGALRETARKVRREAGMSVRFVLGSIQVTGNDGRGGSSTVQVRGVYSQDSIIVQADNLRVSPEQIADHEIFHSYAQQNPGLIQAVEDAIVERYGQEEMDRIVDTYIKNLRGIVDVPESGTDLDFEQAYADIKNEVFADAFAGINAFGAHAEQYQGTVLDTLEERGVASSQSRENAQAMDDRTGPPETYSIDYDQSNRPFVTVEEDILNGVPREDWVKTVKDNLRKKFPNGVTVGNNEIKIDKQSRREMTFSGYTQRLMKTNPELFADKLRALPSADEFIFASRDWVNEGLSHPRKDNIQEFARGAVQLRIGENDYTANVVVATRKNGAMLLYDLLNLKPTKINEKAGRGKVNTVNPQSETDSQATSSANSIAQAGEAVKGGGLFLPTAEEAMGTQRYSADKEQDGPVSNSGTFEDGIMMPKGNEVLDGSMLPTFAEVQARRQQASDALDRHSASPNDRSGGLPAALPTKAREYLQKAERRLMNKVGDLLSVPESAQREFLQNIVRSISNEYLSTGQVSQETRDQLFEQAYQQGVQVDREYYDTYKHVRDYLRSTPITVSEWLKGDIDDYNEWRKGAFGTLRLVKEGGNGPDTAYMELQHMAPELFPDSITHPADQLRHILETAQGIRVSEQSLEEVYGPEAERFKRWSRQDFNEAVAGALEDLKQVKRYADERTQQAEARQAAQDDRHSASPNDRSGGLPTAQTMTVQEVTELWGRVKGARRVYEIAAARNLLTQHDEIQVGRLLRGELELEHLDPARDNVKGITAVYEAKLEYEELAGRIRQWNQQRKAALREQADGFLENANDWKDKAAGILYSRETMERNIRDIVPDQELADQINRAYFQPVHEAAAKANRAKNEYRDRVRELKLSRKAANGDLVSEAHAVQLLGEAEDNIQMLENSRAWTKERDGKTLEDWRGVVQNLWLENPSLDQEKIRGAVKEFRAIYDELFQQMNEARVRNGYEPVNYRKGYFPHFQPGGEGIVALFGKALGIDTAVNTLPTTINGLTHTFKPGIQWFGNAQERLGFNTVYDAVEGFDRYIEGVADVIYQTDNIQALRALGAQARYRTGDDGLREQVDAVRAREGISDAEKQTLIDEINQKGKSAAKKEAIVKSSLSEEEKDAMFRYVLPEDSKGAAYSQALADAGLDRHSAAAVANAVNGLTPKEGAKTVSDAQKWRAVLDAAGSAEDQKTALLAIMSDSARMRYEVADSFGIEPEAWVQLKEALPQFDEDGNGSYTGAEVENAIDALGGNGALLAPWDKDPLRLSREEKAVLWQAFTGNKSGSGNPYSTRVGKQVAQELEKAREEAKK